ncbi:MAG TPA: hypothetical protein VG125_27720 [Pirellulales bacterium]|jgi:hypothetical protein|nr:hypothetical protein [Pirellulales bacterium]
MMLSKVPRGGWVALAVLVVGNGAWSSQAAPARAAKPQGSSSRDVREEALRAIPYTQLDRNARIKVGAVLANTTIFRRLPTETIECDPKLFLFLIEHPDVVVNMWEALGVSEVELLRADELVFDASDKAGTRGRLEYLYHTPQLHLVYADGTYSGSLMARPVRGRCVLLMRSSYHQSSDGRPLVRCTIDTFLHLENIGASVLAKTFQPLVTTAADHNFHETAAFLANVHQAAEANFAGMQRLTEKLNKVDEEDRREFSELTTQLAVRAALAETQAASAPRPSAPRPSAPRSTATRPAPRMRKR